MSGQLDTKYSETVYYTQSKLTVLRNIFLNAVHFDSNKMDCV